MLSAPQGAQAIPVDLTSGTTGTIPPFNQSFNETRGVTAQVLSSVDLNLFSMRLDGFSISLAPGGTVGARVYDDATEALIAWADAAVPVGFNQSLTIPISGLLASGSAYRLAFFVTNVGFNGGSGTVFDPDPLGVGGFPYVESTGLLRLTGAWGALGDGFPVLESVFVPLMSLEVLPVPEPSSFALLAAGLLLVAGVGRRARQG